MSASVVLATELPGAGGGVATTAAVAVAAAGLTTGEDRGVLVVEAAGERRRGPTMLASDAARRLEPLLRERDLPAAARGGVCWLCVPAAGAPAALRVAGEIDGLAVALVHLPAAAWREALDSPPLPIVAGLFRADLPAQRPLAALAATELLRAGLRVRVAARAPGAVAARRAVAGVDPGGRTAARARRLARGLLGLRADRGQALPLVIGAIVSVLVAATVLAAIGGAVAGKGRAQRVADLAAISAARSMRDDYERLFAPARLPNGAVNPRHLERERYLDRALAAAREAASRNGAEPERLQVGFPDRESVAPLRARVRVTAELAPLGEGGGRDVPVEASTEAAASVPSEAASASSAGGGRATASGGGYSGPLAYRQGKPMRPDVAADFDRLAAAAARSGLTLTITSGYRSDAEQAELFARNPDPRWVAPPGQSLHRCGTELDLGPPAAYGWLAANAPRFGFVKRYSWEAWHFGYSRGPAPCSASAVALGGRTGRAGDGAASGSGGLPAYVPARFRAAIARSAARWNVSGALLAAQLMAESNFNPFAVSSAGARGIAQFMPATAAAYGLRDPFDPDAAIDAQARLMSDLLEEFGSIPLALAAYNAGPGAVAACGCVPPYPETQAYVARILGILDGAGELTAPELEVRLVE